MEMADAYNESVCPALWRELPRPMVAEASCGTPSPSYVV